jgi:phospholipid/cholesterol/gamma-HCH transport system permease protein
MLRPLRPIRGFFRSVGRGTLTAARNAGGMGMLVIDSLKATILGRVAFRDVMQQAVTMGIASVPLVMVTAVLSGVVTSQQGGYQFTSSIPLYVLGSVVVQSVILELGPVMTSFVMIGRVGARITAEIGTMVVSEQIDALYSLGRDPVRVLAAPRILAGIFVMPILVGLANFVGMLAGMVAAQLTVGLGSEMFWYGAQLFWHNWDLFYSILKSTAFGLLIPVIATHMGLTTRGGAEGVGRNTTTSVVIMIITLLVVDALFPPLFLN